MYCRYPTYFNRTYEAVQYLLVIGPLLRPGWLVQIKHTPLVFLAFSRENRNVSSKVGRYWKGL
jgi:hypothetical protein